MKLPALYISCLLFLMASCGPPPLKITSFQQQQQQAKLKEQSERNKPSGTLYNVQKGDTLYSIARKFKSNVRVLISHNQLQAPYRLYVQQEIYIPDAQYYIVQTGDTLYSISKKFDLSQNEIVRLNNIIAPYTLLVNQKLILPLALNIQNQNIASKEALPNAAPTSAVVSPVAPEILKQDLQPINKDNQPQQTMTQSAPPALAGTFVMPAEGKMIAKYGEQQRGLFNEGINVKLKEGTPIYAAENGVVVYSDNRLGSYGNMVLIRHDDNYVTAYAHHQRNNVKRGDIVKRRQIIGFAGKTGNVSESQLHFEVRKNNKSIDPLTLIN